MKQPERMGRLRELVYFRIDSERLQSADEILLSGTETGLCTVDKQKGSTSSIYMG
jgi:hypothetical protein